MLDQLNSLFSDHVFIVYYSTSYIGVEVDGKVGLLFNSRLKQERIVDQVRSHLSNPKSGKWLNF